MIDQLKQLPKNITKGWKGTLLGFVIILAALASVFLADMSWTEASIGIVIGLGCVFAPGKKKKDDDDLPPGVGVCVLVLALLMSSCCTYEKCQEKYGSLAKDTVRIEVPIEVPVTVLVPADSVKATVSLDSLQQLAPGDTLNTVADSESGLLNLKVSKGKDKKINIRADYKANIVKDTARTTATVDCPPAVIFQPKEKQGWLQQLWSGYKDVAAFVVIAQLAALMYILLIKRLI